MRRLKQLGGGSAFILGVVPLVIVSGNGTANRYFISARAFGGILAATFLPIFFVPLFFVPGSCRGMRDEVELPAATK